MHHPLRVILVRSVYGGFSASHAARETEWGEFLLTPEPPNTGFFVTSLLRMTDGLNERRGRAAGRCGHRPLRVLERSGKSEVVG